MTDVSKQSLAVLRQIAEFLEGLPPEQVDDLAEGRARLAFVPWGSTTPVVPAAKSARPARKAAESTVDAVAIAARIEAAGSRDEVHSLLDPMKIADLKAVAAALRMAAPAATKAPLIKQIVELTAGARLSGDALRSL
jgi:hypothetical protein